MKIIIKRGKGKQPFYFIIVARNGRTLATSEMYARKQSAERTAKSIASSFRIWQTIIIDKA